MQKAPLGVPIAIGMGVKTQNKGLFISIWRGPENHWENPFLILLFKKYFNFVIICHQL
jgi:hypothetical protein